MDDSLRGSSRTALVVVAIAVAGIGIQGIRDLWVLPYWGFSTALLIPSFAYACLRQGAALRLASYG